MAREISPGADILDSRDVIARLEELESLIQDYRDEIDEAEQELAEAETDAEADEISRRIADAQEEIDDIEGDDEYQFLRDLADEADDIPDWQHGETLINEDYFEDYAQQLAEDIGAIDRDANWPACHIDWEAAADALKEDYVTLSTEDHTYYARA